MNKDFDILAFLMGKQAGGGGGGGGYGYTKLEEADFTVNTSSTSEASVGTIEAGAGAYTSGKMLYVRVRDKAGKRPGYYFGTDVLYINAYPANHSTTNTSSTAAWTVGYLSDNTFKVGSTKYGVYTTSLYNDGRLTVASKYSSSYGTVDGTYHVEVYLLDWPDGVSPLN